MNMEVLYSVGLCAAAFAYHVLEKWGDYRVQEPIGFVKWWMRYPAKNHGSILATGLAFAGCWHLEWMNYGMAMACGYMGDSVFRRIMGKVQQ